MGNFITFLAAIPAPLITKEYLIPVIKHPYNFGGIPFKPPGVFENLFLYLLCNMLIIGSFATLSGMMTTSRQCQKIRFWTAIINARWAMLFALLGMIILYIAPFIKSPILALVSWMPYANPLVTGFLIAIMVLIGGMFGNNHNRRDVCNTS